MMRFCFAFQVFVVPLVEACQDTMDCQDAVSRPTLAFPGEGGHYGDHKCSHGDSRRVCVKLLNSQGEPQKWGWGSFSQISAQEGSNWAAQIRENAGDSMCMSMWTTQRLIEIEGCEFVHVNCDATDLAYVFKTYIEMLDTTTAKECLENKCSLFFKQYAEKSPVYKNNRSISPVWAITLFLCLLSCVVCFGFTAYRVRRARTERLSIEQNEQFIE